MCKRYFEKPYPLLLLTVNFSHKLMCIEYGQVFLIRNKILQVDRKYVEYILKNSLANISI